MATIGSVAVEVVPSIQGFNSKVKAEILPEAEQIGVEAGEEIRSGIDERLHDIRIGAHVEDEVAKAEIERLKLQVDELSHKNASIDVRVNNASGVRSWITSLIAGAVAIAPAFVVAAGGVAGFAALAVPALREVAKYEHDLGTNAAKAATDWANMSATQRTVATELTTLRTEFHGLAAEVQPQVLQVFSAALQQIDRFLPQLVPLAKAGAAALSVLINDIGDAVNGPAGQQFFAFITKNIGADMALIGQTVESLLKALFSLVEALHPLSVGLLTIIRDGADFLSFLSRTSPLLVQMAVAAVALYKPLQVLSGLKLAETFAWIPKAAAGLKGYVATATAAAAVDSAMAASQTEAAVATAGFAVSADGTAVALTGLTAAESAAAASSGVLDAALAGLAAVSPVTWAVAGAAAIAGLTAVLLRSTPTVDAYLNSLAQADKATGDNAAGYQKLADQTTSAAAATGKLRSAIQSTAPAYLQVREGAASYATATARVAQAHAQAQATASRLSSGLGFLESKYGLTQTQAEKLAKAAGVSLTALGGTGRAAQAAAAQVSSYIHANQAATQAASDWAQQMAIATGAAGTLAQKASALAQAMSDIFDPTVNAAQAVARFRDGQAGMTSAIQKANGVLGENTAKQRAATEAATAQVTAAKEAAAAIFAETGSAEKAAGPLERLRAALEAAGVKGGLAAKLLAELNAQIAALHSKEINIRVVESVIGATQGGTIQQTPGSGGHGIHAGAGGTVIPGWSPGRDTSGPWWLSPGEGVAVPELVAAMGGPEQFMGLNRMFSGGRNPAPGHMAAGGGNWTAGGDWAGGGGGRRVSLGDEFDIFLNILNQAAPYSVSSTGVSDSQRLAGEFSHVVGKSVAEIRDMGRTALKDLKDYYTGPHSKELQGALNRQVGALEHLSARSQRIADEIKNMKQYAAQETQSLKQFSDISNITGATDPTTGQAGPVTGKDIKAGLQKDLAQLRKFENVIKRLKRAKVVKVLIEQVIALGPVDGVTYGEAILAGGATLIKQLDREEKEIGKEEKLIGQTAADIHYGQNISKGFLSGLRKERHHLDEEMRRLGDEIAKELLRALHGEAPKGGGKGHGKGKGSAHAALSADALSSAVSVGGTTVISHPLSHSDVADMRSHLHRISDGQLQLMTRQQGTRLINLLTEIHKDAPSETGVAVAKALDGTASSAASKARAKTR